VLEPVNVLDENHIQILYRLLQERYDPSCYANIPGMATDELPTYKQHKQYLISEPYKFHVLFHEKRQPDIIKAALYLKRDGDVGIFVFKKYWGQGIGTKALTEFLEFLKYYTRGTTTATVNIENKASQALFEKLGFQKVGYVYKL
jgi:RimJ/RimL family protein N-acetyltransferase